MSFRLIDPFRDKKELTQREQEAMKYLVKFHRKHRRRVLFEKFKSSKYKRNIDIEKRNLSHYFEQKKIMREDMKYQNKEGRSVRDIELYRIEKIRFDHLERESEHDEFIESRDNPISVVESSDEGNTYLYKSIIYFYFDFRLHTYRFKYYMIYRVI